jgi:hypothetical protein
MQCFVNPFCRKDTERQPQQKSKEEQTIPRYWLISAKNKAAVRNRVKAFLHQTSPKIIKLHQHPPKSPPRTTRKSYGGDAQGRIHPNPFLGQPERVMERMQREETPRLGVSEGMRIRIRPIPFLGQPERVMEMIQREETPRLGVSEGIRLRISR